MTKEQRIAAVKLLLRDREQLARFKYNWKFNARPEQLLPDDDSWSICLMLAGRGGGKAISLFTPIWMADGSLKAMGDVNVGDAVVDQHGDPCTVTAVYEVPDPESCFDLVFSNKERIRACSEHQWVTWTKRESDRLVDIA